MIVVRRFVAILLIPIFLVWFTASTVRSGLDRTLFDDSFLADQLEKQDFYNWLHDDLVRVALDDLVDVGRVRRPGDHQKSSQVPSVDDIPSRVPPGNHFRSAC